MRRGRGRQRPRAPDIESQPIRTSSSTTLSERAPGLRTRLRRLRTAECNRGETACLRDPSPCSLYPRFRGRFDTLLGFRGFGTTIAERHAECGRERASTRSSPNGVMSVLNIAGCCGWCQRSLLLW